MASGSATVVALKARAYQICHLCFPVNGIVESLGSLQQFPIFRGNSPRFPGGSVIGLPRPIQLGDPATLFDYWTFCTGLGKTAKDLSRLSYNSSGILNDANVQASLLMTLRAEPIAALLDKAINARQNAYYAKYANQQKIISVMHQYYGASSDPPSANPSKPDALAELYACAQNQMNDLGSAYGLNMLPTLPGLPNVVSSTQSNLSTTGSFPDTNQTIINTDYAYRAPTYEAQAQGLRAQISLLDQQFSQFMAGQNLSNLKQVFDNEKHSIDLDVKQLQIAYLNTILTSPINGVITGIYKNPGDWVRAGEPVMRVEDNSSVILVGTLAYQGPISIGSQLTITTPLFDASSTQPIVANVVAARGRAGQDDMWDVHAICANTTTPALPLNYNFDYDDTSVSISN